MNNRVLIGSLMLLVLACLPALAAAEVQLKSVRWGEGNRPRLFIDFSAAPAYRLSRSADPTRLAIDVRNASASGRLVQPPVYHPVAARIGAAPGRTRNSLSLGVDLKIQSEARSHIENLGDAVRLVVEWPAVARGSPSTMQRAADLVPDRRKRERNAQLKPAGRFVVAIDAGHGGKDTGAVGPNGVREKDVVLAIARKLAGFIRAQRGMRAVMVRDGDRFVSLRRRREIARRAGADLLVSLHADAHESVAAKGSSVYTLRKYAALEASDLAAMKVLRELKKDLHVHHNNVQRAGFMVLKCQDVPSLLVETAFISNPEEESKLKKPRHQERVARTLFNGIRAYAARRQPALPAGFRVAEADRN